MSVSSYPMHVDAHLDSGLSRWLWLVKWVLVIPHYIVLAFLWVAFLALSIAAFFAILFTGRYPRAIFDFNVGVLRWSWRVAYYAYGALGTDRYPPFTLAEVPDYPAHLSVDSPEHLSRGLVLVKWWLLAIPHYLIVAIFAGGGLYWTTEAAGGDAQVEWGGGLIGLLVFVAGLVLLFTGRYPTGLFDFILGLNRWVLRVAAYAGLMTDEYPPFRFDSGPHDPGYAVATRSPGVIPPGSAATTEVPAAAPPAGPAPGGVLTGPPAGPPPTSAPTPPSSSTTGWTAGRVIALSFGILLTLVAIGSGIGAGTVALADATLRDDDGFLMSPDQPIATQTYAVVSDRMQVHTEPAPDFLPEGLLGDAKVEVTSDAGPVFVGLARASDVESWLAGVPYAVTTRLPMNGDDASYRLVDGTGAPGDPTRADFWVAKASGTDTQSITWPLEDGTWTIVVMNADSSRGVVADVSAGVTIPGISWVVAILLSIALTSLVIAILLLVAALHRPRPAASAPPAPPAPPAGGSW